MRVLVIGGTSFIGPPLVRRLVSLGHEVVVFHRGQTQADLPPGVEHLLGDRHDLGRHVAESRRIAPDVVVDMIAFTEADALGLVQTFRGLARRSVVISSADVYRAYGRFLGLESDPIEPTSLVTRGRTTAEMGRPEEDLHLWRLVAEECGCFDRPYSFANDHARFLFYRQESPNPHYVPYEAHRCTVTMMSGLPGSGKDAWLAAHRPDLPVVSLDDVRDDLHVEATDDQGGVIRAARERCRELLRSGRSFAFNATNLLRQTRKRWIDLFADYEARIEVVYVEPPLPVNLDRNGRRERPVPEKVIRGLAGRCEPPTWTEAHGLTIVCEGAGAGSGRLESGEQGHDHRRLLASELLNC